MKNLIEKAKSMIEENYSSEYIQAVLYAERDNNTSMDDVQKAIEYAYSQTNEDQYFTVWFDIGYKARFQTPMGVGTAFPSNESFFSAFMEGWDFAEENIDEIMKL